MSKLGWLLGGWDELCFKRVPDGWLFAAPSIWPRRTYRVTDEQKAELSKPLRRMMRVQLAAIVVICFVLGTVLEGRDGFIYWLSFGVACVVMMALSWAYTSISMRPLLSGLVPTQEHITFADRFKLQAAAVPTAVIIIMALFSLVLFAGGVFVWLKGKLDAQMIVGMVTFGALSLYWLALFVAKQKLRLRRST